MRWSFVLTSALAIAALDTATGSLLRDALVGEARAEQRSTRSEQLRVGDQLQATRDVELDEATIAEGSKVSVSRLKQASGKVLLDVALADGHVVRDVPLAKIAESFRRVGE